MPENIVMIKMLQDVLHIANSSVNGDEAKRRFSSMLAEFFGIEKVSVLQFESGNNVQSSLYDYVSNTKKIYIDNQLSEYSSFPELIGYRSRGFRSCAVLPIVIGGKAVSIIEMLSHTENKFSNDLIGSASLGAYVIGLTMLYKLENERSMKLAGYFNGAFNAPYCQLLVAQDGSIVKANDKARRDIIPVGGNKNVEELIGVNFERLASIAKGGSLIMQTKLVGRDTSYRISTNMVNERLVHVSLLETTKDEQLYVLLHSMDTDSSIGVLYLDNNLTINEATDSIKRSTGYDKNLIIGRNLIELVIEKQRGEIKELLEKQAALESIRGTMDLSTAAGIPTHMRFTLSKYAGGYIMLFSDATTEGYIESIRDAFSDFINSTSNSVITMDELGYIKDCNAAAESVLGYSKSELIGRDMRTLYYDQSVFDRDITYVKNGTKVDNSYASLLGRNGAKIDATHSIRLFKGSNTTDYLIVVKELETKRRLSDLADELEKEKNRVSKLESTGSLKSQFIYNISHELKTPLTNIKGFSKLLYAGEFGDLNKDQLDYISTIMEETDRLMQIIQQVLDAAKLESEKMKLELREVDLKEMGNNPSIQAMKDSALGNGLTFSWNVDWDVPKITADPNRLIQAFVNLIGNSIKFTNKGGDINVRIKRLGKTMVLCEVKDTGIGINDEDRRKLFRKFYEAPKKGLVKQERAGTGLGLSITREIVRLHGGRINCESEQGKGSRFFFTLRIKPRHKKEKE